MALYLLALSMIYLMPGPDMILLLQVGARQGRAAALSTALGLAAARAAHVALTAMGMAALFKALPWTFDVVKFAGAAYLLWLGLQMFKSTASSGPAADRTEHSVSGSLTTAFLRGLLTNLLNPKALIFCSVLLPQFIDPAAPSVTAQFLLLGSVLVITGLLFDGVYASTSVWLSRWLNKSATAQRVQHWLFGTLLIGFALRLTFVQAS